MGTQLFGFLRNGAFLGPKMQYKSLTKSAYCISLEFYLMAGIQKNYYAQKPFFKHFRVQIDIFLVSLLYFFVIVLLLKPLFYC